MSTKTFDRGGNDRLVFGFAGDRSIDDIRHLLDQLGTDVTVTRVKLELEPEDDLDVSLPGGVHLESTAGEGPGDPPAGARLQADSVPYRIVRLLAEREEPMRTAEITDALTTVDLSQNEISSRLWNLSNRGLVHKRAYEEDRRQKVYTVSEVGRAALEAARERAA